MIACLDQHQRRRGIPLAGGEPNPSADTDPEFLPADSHPSASADFGGILHSLPAAVVRPSTAADVARTIRFAAQTDHLTVAARGNGHSIHGQAMAPGGIVLDMRALTGRKELVGPGLLADVPAGALWEEVLDWAVLEHGLAPVSWTDYLGLTVGGTISNGGISGQAWKMGPQVSNVTELEVVTGDGERRVCSPSVLPDLFFSVLGGLGQFGVITRARIPLAPAPDMVKWIRVVYGRFEEYSGDAERLVGRPGPAGGFDYIEGFAFVNRDDPVNGWGSVPLKSGSEFDPAMVPPDSGPVLYCLEVAVHYNQRDAAAAAERAAEMLRPLRYVRGLEFAVETSYVSFLTRVKRAEEAARADGTWHAPHPWLNLLVSAADIADFDRHVFQRILKDGVGGPMLVYPLLRSKWDPRMSVALPEGEVFYLVALLRFGPLPAVEEMLRQNREIVERCEDGGYDYKLYLPHYESQADWARHFGRGWSRFVERKARYNPQAILSPGQGIFSRTPGGEAAAAPPPPTVLCEDVGTWTSD